MIQLKQVIQKDLLSDLYVKKTIERAISLFSSVLNSLKAEINNKIPIITPINRCSIRYIGSIFLHQINFNL